MDQDFNLMNLCQHISQQNKQRLCHGDEPRRLHQSVASLIHRARIKRGYRSHKDLAFETGVSPKIVREYEEGGGLVDDTILRKLAKKLGIESSIFFDD